MKSCWDELLTEARELIDQSLIGDDWTFGGGTAMMLQIAHRESHDIDIFVDDPQYLGCLDPSRQNFRFSIQPSGYGGDGSRFLKIVFEDKGEIDFITAQALTKPPFTETEVLGRVLRLETVAEIVTKKIFYRGSSIEPRDLFDIAAAATAGFEADIICAMADYPEKVQAALDCVERMNPDYVDVVISALQINDDFRHLETEARQIARDILEKALANPALSSSGA